MIQITNRKIVLIIAALSSFLMTFTGASINIALPTIGTEFQMDAVLLGWVANAFNLATVVAFLPIGRLADIHGRKKILILGVFLYAATSILLLFTPSAAALISLRVIQGISSAMVGVNAIAILTSVFPAGERGKALGIAIAATYMGLSLGPVLGGLLTYNFGWRSIFILTMLLSLIIVAIVFKKMDGEWAAARGEKFDVKGSLIYGSAIVALLYGLFLLPEMLGVVLIVAGCLGILAFIRWETGIGYPILNIDLFRKNRIFAFSNLAVLINYGATYAVTFLLSLYLQYIKGLSPQTAGLILVATPAVQAAFSPLAGRLSDRIEPRIIASIGMAITTGALGAFIFLDEGVTLVFIIAALAILGFGLGLFSSPNTNAVMGSVTEKVYGVASATQATMRHMGMMFSMGIVMLLFVIFMGRVEVTPEYYVLFIRSTSVSFIIFTILCFGGIFAQLAGGKNRK